MSPECAWNDNSQSLARVDPGCNRRELGVQDVFILSVPRVPRAIPEFTQCFTLGVLWADTGCKREAQVNARARPEFAECALSEPRVCPVPRVFCGSARPYQELPECSHNPPGVTPFFSERSLGAHSARSGLICESLNDMHLSIIFWGQNF